MSKEKSCKCCKQIWYVDMLDKKLGLCPNCYGYCKPLIDDLKIKDKIIKKLNLQDKRIKELEATNKILSNELTQNGIVKQDRLETCYGIPIYEIPKLKEENQQLKQSQKQLALDKLEMLQAVFESTIIDEVLRNYVCSIIRGEIEILIGEENE